MALTSWITSSLVRHFPLTPPHKAKPYTIDVARNERFSFQFCMHNAVKRDNTVYIDKPIDISVSATAPKGWSIRIRRVGYVPMAHHNTRTSEDELDGLGHIPGYVPDPLFDERKFRLPPNETHTFWLTAVPGINARVGINRITVRLIPVHGKPQTHTVQVRVHPLTIKPGKDFFVTHWFYNDALLDFYNCVAFDKRYWEVLPNYFRNIARHGQNTVYTPVFTPPLDGVKRPSQLLRVRKIGKDKYSLNWRDVKKYVDLAKKCGLKHFEWTHLFTQWGVKYAIRIYENQGVDEKLLWKPETGATSKTYYRFLKQFLPRFYRFLIEEKLLERSFFHISDEPHGDEHLKNYRKARAMLKELAPWMQVMDAVSDIRFYRAGLTDMPIPGIPGALDFIKEGISCGCYYCCGPRGRFLNRLMDTPLPKIRMNGWLFYRWPFKGFLHWGYNYWYKSQTRIKIDPYTVQDGLRWSFWPYGDCFVVYPGKNGPVDSIRWEVFAESLQDYALLQTLGVNRDSPLLSALRSFDDFPKSEAWLARTRKNLFALYNPSYL